MYYLCDLYHLLSFVVQNSKKLNSRYLLCQMDTLLQSDAVVTDVDNSEVMINGYQCRFVYTPNSPSIICAICHYPTGIPDGSSYKCMIRHLPNLRTHVSCSLCTVHLILSIYYKIGKIMILIPINDIVDPQHGMAHRILHNYRMVRWLPHDQFVFSNAQYELRELLDITNGHHMRVALMREFIGVDIGWYMGHLYIAQHKEHHCYYL